MRGKTDTKTNLCCVPPQKNPPSCSPRSTRRSSQTASGGTLCLILASQWGMIYRLFSHLGMRKNNSSASTNSAISPSQDPLLGVQEMNVVRVVVQEAVL